MIDPYRVLGVEPEASDEAIRAAYLAAIRQSPPERDRERFANVREAYEAISDQRRGARTVRSLGAQRRRSAKRREQRLRATLPE
jgi:curved DNA-binding protein CbpA